MLGSSNLTRLSLPVLLKQPLHPPGAQAHNLSWCILSLPLKHTAVIIWCRKWLVHKGFLLRPWIYTTAAAICHGQLPLSTHSYIRQALFYTGLPFTIMTGSLTSLQKQGNVSQRLSVERTRGENWALTSCFIQFCIFWNVLNMCLQGTHCELHSFYEEPLKGGMCKDSRYSKLSRGQGAEKGKTST